MKSKIILTVICIIFLTTSISSGYKATFIPRLSVEGQYTDNIFLTEDKDLKEDDFITSVNPGFTAEILGKNNGAKISYDAAYAMYDKWDEFDGWRHKANLTGWSQVTKYTYLSIRDNFRYTEDPIRDEKLAEIRTEDPNIPIDSTVRKIRNTYYRNIFTVGLSHQFGKYDSSFGIGYNYWYLEEKDPSREDKKQQSPFASVKYWFSPQWGFDVNGSYARSEREFSDNDADIFSGSVSLVKRFGKHFTGNLRYSHSVVKYKEESGNDITYYPSIGIIYEIEKDISLIANFGYFYNDYINRESESDFGGDLRLIKLFEHGKLNLAVLGGYDYTFFNDEYLGFNVYYEPSVSLTYQLAKHVNSNIFASYRNSDFVEFDREDKIVTAGLELSWRALEWMDIGINYRFRTLDSTISTEEYDENRAGVSIKVFPTVPFHTSRY